LPVKTEEGQEGEEDEEEGEEDEEETLLKVSKKVAHDHPKQGGPETTKANRDGKSTASLEREKKR